MFAGELLKVYGRKIFVKEIDGIYIIARRQRSSSSFSSSYRKFCISCKQSRVFLLSLIYLPFVPRRQKFRKKWRLGGFKRVFTTPTPAELSLYTLIISRYSVPVLVIIIIAVPCLFCGRIFHNNNSHYNLPVATFPIMRIVFKMYLQILVRPPWIRDGDGKYTPLRLSMTRICRQST